MKTRISANRTSANGHCNGSRRSTATGLVLAAAFSAPAFAQLGAGACCLPHETCAWATLTECKRMKGTPIGQGVPCSQGICDGMGVKYSGSPVTIPDGTGSAGAGAPAYAAISVPGSRIIESLRVSVHVPHTYQGDLRLALTHIDTGTSAVLINRPGVTVSSAYGFSADNYGLPQAIPGTPPPDLMFDDSASAPYALPTIAMPGINNVTGAFKPVTPLGVFTGENAAGAWVLSATDFAGGDVGSIVRVELFIEEPLKLPAGVLAQTIQGLIPDADFMLIGQAAGLPASMSYSSTYNGLTWSASMCGGSGQPCFTYSGGTASATATSTNWTMSGQAGGTPVSASGTAQVTLGATDLQITIHETLQVGSRTYTIDGSYEGTTDAEGRLVVNSGTDIIADSGNPGGGNPGWGRRWMFDHNTGMWVSMYRIYLPGAGWQDFAFNESYFAPLAQPGWFTMTQTIRRSCYANCDASSIAPVLNANDFTCFLNRFAAGDSYTNCDGSSVPPLLNANDFQCFLSKFALGCS